jgi:hypothetical protein
MIMSISKSLNQDNKGVVTSIFEEPIYEVEPTKNLLRHAHPRLVRVSVHERIDPITGLAWVAQNHLPDSAVGLINLRNLCYTGTWRNFSLDNSTYVFLMSVTVVLVAGH